MPQHDKVLLTVVLAHATAIFLKGQIEHPMQPIFDAPMCANGVSKGLGIACQAHHVVAPFAGDLLTHSPLRFDHTHTAQPSPRLLRIEIGDHFRIGNRPLLAPFHSAVSCVLRWVGVMQQVSTLRGQRIRKQIDHILIQGALIGFEG
jgi:hypothetical protein